jgi:hypothetical protein
MPVILTKVGEIEQWMSEPAEDALKLQLQRPLADGMLKIVTTGDRRTLALGPTREDGARGMACDSQSRGKTLDAR